MKPRDLYDGETEPMPILGTVPDARVVQQIARISPDTCGILTYLLKKTSCKLFISNVRGVKGAARIIKVEPDYEKPGYVKAVCSTTFQGYVELQIGSGVKLDFYFL